MWHAVGIRKQEDPSIDLIAGPMGTCPASLLFPISKAAQSEWLAGMQITVRGKSAAGINEQQEHCLALFGSLDEFSLLFMEMFH